MKILAVADEESKYLWDYYTPEKLQGVDLLISCGDLSRPYVNFLSTMAPVPLMYVHGNHDDSYDTAPSFGGVCLEDEVVVHNGLRIAGLGGSFRYSDGTWQFTEAEMRRRVKKLCGKIDKAGGLDVLVTHAPMFGLGDDKDLPHRGFEAFRVLLEKYRPQVMVHGHIHMCYGANTQRELQYGSIRVINACERITFEVEPPQGMAPFTPFWMRFANRG